ncbi:MAG TPA: ABC transporter ATP-binding protein, partial [Vicinamibacterales bacterium]
PSFYDYLTAEELLTYFAQLFGYAPAERRTRVSNLLDRVGIGAERRLQLRKFSKGMIQRVGIAQALLNDPEVIFLDEPMSGLDPLGRRDVRRLILDLRDSGRTVFFSSHILADAEALCRRVAVVAAGRLAATGALSDILAFQVRGWEVVIAGLAPEVLARLSPVARRVTEISQGRYSLELPLEHPPERVLPDVMATGAQLISVNPLRETLEDFFVQRVAEVGAGARAAGEQGHAGH